MWNLEKIEWEQARARAGFDEASSVKVAVLDTGIDSQHPDLGTVAAYTHRYDHPVAPVDLSAVDIVGHGTHVAGTIAASIHNGIGINGISAAAIHAYKIFNDADSFLGWSGGFAFVVNPVAYLRALAACLDTGVNVVNLSIGGPKPPDPHERDLYRRLIERGAIVVAAMGNERERGNPTSYPAAIPGVIAVGATRPDDRIASFSNSGSHISLCAPGVAIWSTLPTFPGYFGHPAYPDGNGRAVRGPEQKREVDYDHWDGTSMATPHVSAAAALLLANHGEMEAAAVRQRLMATADALPGMKGASFDPDYGAGRLNLRRALFE